MGVQHLLDEEEAKPSRWQGRLQKQQRGWLQNMCKRGRAPRLAPDNHPSNSSSGRALVAVPLNAVTSAIATGSKNQERRTAREGARRDGGTRKRQGAKDGR